MTDLPPRDSDSGPPEGELNDYTCPRCGVNYQDQSDDNECPDCGWPDNCNDCELKKCYEECPNHKEGK